MILLQMGLSLWTSPVNVAYAKMPVLSGGDWMIIPMQVKAPDKVVDSDNPWSDDEPDRKACLLLLLKSHQIKRRTDHYGI